MAKLPISLDRSEQGAFTNPSDSSNNIFTNSQSNKNRVDANLGNKLNDSFVKIREAIGDNEVITPITGQSASTDISVNISRINTNINTSTTKKNSNAYEWIANPTSSANDEGDISLSHNNRRINIEYREFIVNGRHVKPPSKHFNILLDEADNNINNRLGGRYHFVYVESVGANAGTYQLASATTRISNKEARDNIMAGNLPELNEDQMPIYLIWEQGNTGGAAMSYTSDAIDSNRVWSVDLRRGFGFIINKTQRAWSMKQAIDQAERDVDSDTNVDGNIDGAVIDVIPYNFTNTTISARNSRLFMIHSFPHFNNSTRRMVINCNSVPFVRNNGYMMKASGARGGYNDNLKINNLHIGCDFANNFFSLNSNLIEISISAYQGTADNFTKIIDYGARNDDSIISFLTNPLRINALSPSSGAGELFASRFIRVRSDYVYDKRIIEHCAMLCLPSSSQDIAYSYMSTGYNNYAAGTAFLTGGSNQSVDFSSESNSNYSNRRIFKNNYLQPASNEIALTDVGGNLGRGSVDGSQSGYNYILADANGTIDIPANGYYRVTGRLGYFSWQSDSGSSERIVVIMTRRGLVTGFYRPLFYCQSLNNANHFAKGLDFGTQDVYIASGTYAVVAIAKGAMDLQGSFNMRFERIG